MIRNVIFGVIALFWVVMNALLWHNELGPGELAASVPPETVFEKILSAPDASTLAVVRGGEKLGFLRWRPVVTEASPDGKVASGNEPQGMVRRISRYLIELEGSLLLPEWERTLKLDGNLEFGRALDWRGFVLRASMRPMRWEIKATAEERALWIIASEGETEWIRRLTFDELRDPRRLLPALNMPAAAAMLPPARAGAPSPALSFRPEWEARFDWLRIGRGRVRVYRLEARLPGRQNAVFLISRVGEILRAELPGGLKLLNDALYSL